jgi:threonine dehydratase
VLVPCGGGGLSSGIGIAIRDTYPDLGVTLVEPEGFDDYRRSLAEGRPVANARNSGSVCDALLAPSPGAIGFALNSANRARAVTVSDGDALAAVAFAFRELKLTVEPGGAVALAALLAGKVNARGAVVVVVLSGGNIDMPILARALAENP